MSDMVVDVSGSYFYENWNPLNLGVQTVAEGAFALWPNPASSYVEIAGANTASGFSIVNGVGTVVRQGRLAVGSSKHRIDVSRLPVGVYVLRVHGAATDFWQRLIVE